MENNENKLDWVKFLAVLLVASMFPLANYLDNHVFKRTVRFQDSHGRIYNVIYNEGK